MRSTWLRIAVALVGVGLLALVTTDSGDPSTARATSPSDAAAQPRARPAVAAPSAERAIESARLLRQSPEVNSLVVSHRAPSALAAHTCGRPAGSGGEWTLLNRDHANSRHQSDERTIAVGNADALRPAWSFSATAVGAPGGMRSTPIVAGGCVYLAFGQGYLGDRGDVVALDADTGNVVWHVEFDASVLGLAYANGLIYATPSRGTRGEVAMPVVTEDYQPAGSYAVALDAHTGDVAWVSERLDDGNAANGTFINASPVPIDSGGRRMVFVPLSGGSGDGARVPMYFLDAVTGATVKKAFSLTGEEYAAGFGGTGIWSTAAYDPVGRHLYAGTADSDAKTKQHPYNNALIKIDADPGRATFATVTGAYQGTTEHAGLDSVFAHNPACGLVPTGFAVQPPTFFDTSAAPECLELDLDFGASPNLSVDRAGRLKVSALQKSGIFHFVVTETMRADWTFAVGPGGAAMHSATAAIDGNSVYVGATPNLLFRIDRGTGALGWASTTAVDAFAYQPLSLANGALYAINDLGFLVIVDATTGRLVSQRSIARDGEFPQCLGAGAGVAIARHTVFVPCDAGGLSDIAGLPQAPGGLVAYR